MLYNDKLQVANLRSVPHEHRSHTHKGCFFLGHSSVGSSSALISEASELEFDLTSLIEPDWQEGQVQTADAHCTN